MKLHKQERRLEAILFASGDPVSVERLSQAIDEDEISTWQLLKNLRDHYDETASAISLIELEKSWQLATRTEFAQDIKAALDVSRNIPLSSAALEVLAIIAYNQPVTRLFIEQVRGIDSSSTVTNLVEKGLVQEAGRLELPGRPISYGTSANFLRTFGLTSIEDLPRVGRFREEVKDKPEEPEQSSFFDADGDMDD